MTKILKPVASLGGAALGGIFGGPAGALIGGALGSSLSGVGNVDLGGAGGGASIGAPPNVMNMASAAGFNGNINTPAFALSGNTLNRADLSIPRAQIGIDAQMQSMFGQTGGLRANLASIRPNFAGTAASLESLRGEVRPGFGRLTESRVQAIRNAGAESMGNLRESLSRRGVMGSSFANDAETRTRLAIGQEEERARAEAMVQEIGMSRQIITDQITNELTRFGAELGLAQEDRAILGQQSQVLAQRFTQLANMMDRELNELGVVGNIRNGVNAAISQQAIQMAQLQMLQQSGNAQLSQQAALANAGNEAGFMGLGTSGLMGLFAQQNQGFVQPRANGMVGSI